MLLVLFLPETYYERGSTLEEMLHAPPQAARFEASPTQPHSDNRPSDVEKVVPGIADAEDANRGNLEPECKDLVGTGYPSRKQRWAIIVRPNKREASMEMVLRQVLKPFLMVFYPVVLYGGLCVAMPACALIVVSLLYSNYLVHRLTTSPSVPWRVADTCNRSTPSTHTSRPPARSWSLRQSSKILSLSVPIYALTNRQ